MNEKKLWLAVIQTYLVDSAKVFGDDRSFAFLLHEANSKHTKSICDYTGINHETLIKRMRDVNKTGIYVAVDHLTASELNVSESLEF